MHVTLSYVYWNLGILRKSKHLAPVNEAFPIKNHILLKRQNSIKSFYQLSCCQVLQEQEPIT